MSELTPNDPNNLQQQAMNQAKAPAPGSKRAVNIAEEQKILSLKELNQARMEEVLARKEADLALRDQRAVRIELDRLKLEEARDRALKRRQQELEEAEAARLKVFDRMKQAWIDTGPRAKSTLVGATAGVAAGALVSSRLQADPITALANKALLGAIGALSGHLVGSVKMFRDLNAKAGIKNKFLADQPIAVAKTREDNQAKLSKFPFAMAAVQTVKEPPPELDIGIEDRDVDVDPTDPTLESDSIRQIAADVYTIREAIESPSHVYMPPLQAAVAHLAAIQTNLGSSTSPLPATVAPAQPAFTESILTAFTNVIQGLDARIGGGPIEAPRIIIPESYSTRPREPVEVVVEQVLVTAQTEASPVEPPVMIMAENTSAPVVEAIKDLKTSTVESLNYVESAVTAGSEQTESTEGAREAAIEAERRHDEQVAAFDKIVDSVNAQQEQKSSGWLASAAAFFGAAGGLLTTFFGSITGFLAKIPIIGTLVSSINFQSVIGMVKSIPILIKNFGRAFGPIGVAVGALMTLDLKKDLLDPVIGIIDSFTSGNLLEGFGKLVALPFDLIGKIVLRIGADLMSLVGADKVAAWLSSVSDKFDLFKIYENGWARLKQIGVEKWQSVVDLWNSITLSDTVEDFKNKLKTTVVGLWDGVIGLWKDFSLADTVTDFQNKIKGIISGLWDSVIKKFTNFKFGFGSSDDEEEAVTAEPTTPEVEGPGVLDRISSWFSSDEEVPPAAPPTLEIFPDEKSVGTVIGPAAPPATAAELKQKNDSLAEMKEQKEAAKMNFLHQAYINNNSTVVNNSTGLMMSRPQVRTGDPTFARASYNSFGGGVGHLMN